MPSSFQIRSFETEDEAQVAEIYRSNFGYPTPHNRPELSIQRKLDFQPELFLVAEKEGRVLGTVMGGYDGHRGWIYSLAVVPDARKEGIGSALVRRVESALKELGCPKVNLQILTENETVVQFYESLGFTVEPRISMGKLLY